MAARRTATSSHAVRLRFHGSRGYRDRQRLLAHLIKRMPPVAPERPHLTWPATFFHRLRPLGADEDVRAIDLVTRAVARTLVRNLLLRTADAHGKVLPRHPRHRAHAGDLEEIGDVLGVVDLVEESLFVGIDIHAHHKEVP